MSGRRPVAAVGIVCLRGEDVLLIRRGKPPFENQWSLPGGRIEWGERAADAALRELKEETGCDAEIVGLIDVVDAVMTARSGGEADSREPWGHYVLIDYAARWIAGEPAARDDAREARFFAAAEIEALGLWDQTLRVIEAARARRQVRSAFAPNGHPKTLKAALRTLRCGHSRPAGQGEKS